MNTSNNRSLLPFLTAVLFALAGGFVRLYRLADQSLWTDEIAAVLVSGRSFFETILNIAVQDVNPPLYYALLHFWMKIGATESFLRLFSVLFSMATIALVYWLANKLFDRETSVFAALLMAFSPLSVYLSQEVRYYTLLEFCAVASIAAYINLREGGRRIWLILALTAGLYTHYYFLLILFTIVVWFFMDYKSGQISDKTGSRPILISLLLWFPWVFAIGIQVGRQSFQFRESISVGALLVDLATFLTVGHADGLNPLTAQPLSLSALWLAGPFLVVFLIFVVTRWNDTNARRLLLWIFIPVLTVILASRSMNLYGHRYLIIILPAFLIAIAAGIRSVGRVSIYLIPIPLFALIALQAVSLTHYFSDAGFWRENWRDMAAYVHTQSQRGDALLFYNQSQAGPFMYYFEGGLPAEYALTGDFRKFTQAPKDQIEGRLKIYFKRHKRIFFISQFGHMYEPAGFTKDFINKKCIPESRKDYESIFKIPMDFCFTSRKNAFRSQWRRYGTAIDFKNKTPAPSQIEGDLTHVTEPWAWVGKWARFYLKNPNQETTLTLKLMIDLKYHKNEPVPFVVVVDGTPLSMQQITKSGISEFTLSLPKIKGELVEIGLLPKRTFNPKEFFGGNDESPKAFMIGYVGLSWPAPGSDY